MNPKDLVGAKKAPLRYVPSALSIEASGPMEDGAIKYGPFNWRQQPVELMTYVEAVERHLAAFKDGQDNAEDSGHSHIGHAIAGLGIIADAKANGTLIDNRYTPGPAANMLRARDKSVAPATVNKAEVRHERLLNGEDPETGLTAKVSPDHQGEQGVYWRNTPAERGVDGYLLCCGATQHGLDCPQWR